MPEMQAELFNPRMPLPNDVVLIHDQGGGGAKAWLFFTLAGILGLIAAFGVLELALRVPHDIRGDFWFIGAVVLGVAAGALWLFFKARASRQAQADIAAGTYRYGLFFLHDKLILRSGPVQETWHIDEVTDVKLVMSRDPNRAGRNVEDLVLVLRDQGGATREHILKAAGALAEAQSALAQRITRWRHPTFRDLPIPERFR